MPAVYRTSGAAAFKVYFRFENGTHHGMRLKKTDRQERDGCQAVDTLRINAQRITKRPVNPVFPVLKMKELQGFFREGRNVKIKEAFPEFRMVK